MLAIDLMNKYINKSLVIVSALTHFAVNTTAVCITFIAH